MERAKNELLARGRCHTIISNSVSDPTPTPNFCMWYNREGVRQRGRCYCYLNGQKSEHGFSNNHQKDVVNIAVHQKIIPNPEDFFPVWFPCCFSAQGHGLRCQLSRSQSSVDTSVQIYTSVMISIEWDSNLHTLDNHGLCCWFYQSSHEFKFTPL